LLCWGTVSCMGEINKVVDTYLSADRSEAMEQSWDSIESAPGNDWVRLKHVELRQAAETGTDHLTVRTPFHVLFEFWVLQPALLNLSMHVNSITGETIFADASPVVDCGIGIARFTCDVPGNLMNDGVYSIMMMIVKDSTVLFVLNDAVIFEVRDAERTGNWMGKWPGAVRPRLAWVSEVIPSEYTGSV
jgi:lipopolysaccharide transport system ATP-binding protein